MIYYDDEINVAIYLTLFNERSLNYTQLKTKVDDHVGRKISHDAYTSHLKQLTELKKISKEDQGRGKPVFYSLTDNQRQEIVEIIRNFHLMEDLYQYIFYFYTHIIQYSPIENLDQLLRDYNLSLKKLKEEFQRIRYIFQIIPNDEKKEDVIILDRTIEIQYKQLEKGLKLVKYEKWSYQTKTLRNAQIKNAKKITVEFSADIIFNILQTTLKKKHNINTPNYHEIEFRLIPEFLEKQLLYDLFTGLAQKYDIMASKIEEIIIRNEGILKPSSISSDYFEFSDHRLHYIIKDLKEIAMKKREIQQLKNFIVQVSLLNEKPTLDRYNKSPINNIIIGLSDYDIRELKKIVVKLESDIVKQIQLLKNAINLSLKNIHL